MDPNELLDNIIGQAEDIIDNYKEYDGEDPLADDAANLAEDILNLHKWIKKGGFLPEEWGSLTAGVLPGISKNTYHNMLWLWGRSVKKNPGFYKHLPQHVDFS